MTALLSACVAFQLNASMMSAVLPTMAKELNTDEVAVGLSQTAFFTSGAIFGVFLPRLSDIRGRRLVLSALMVFVVIGIARIIQGCSGPVVPICLLMLRATVTEPRRYGTLMGLITAVNGGVAGVDALLGGYLATHVGFRGAFWTMAVVAVVALVFVLRWAPESRPSEGTRMDWLGVAPLVASVGCVLFALNEAGKLGAARWVLVVAVLLLAVALFAVFYQVEKRRTDPLVNPVHLGRRETWALLLTTMLTLTGVFATINGLVVSFAQDSQVGFGLRPDVTSLLLLTPFALVGWIVGPFAGRLAPRIGYRKVLRYGLAGSIVALALMATVGLRSLPALVLAAG